MPFDGADQFIVGVNLPWVGYGTDFGASAWYPSGGLSAQPARRDLLERTLATLAPDGIRVVRTFLLCDARSGVRFDGDVMPAGLDDAVLADLDVLMDAARRHQIQLMPVLLDFHLCNRARIVNGVQTGGRTRLLADPVARSAFLDLVLRPIVERYRDEEAVIAWDVINEPEWCLKKAVSFDTLQDFLRQSVACVRASARQPVTIGCAAATGLHLVRPLGLDFYQVHWYERFGWAALERPVGDFDLDGRPVIIGEFPGRIPQAGLVLDTARQAGYAGALVWSMLADDRHSAYPPDVAEWLRAAGP